MEKQRRTQETRSYEVGRNAEIVRPDPAPLVRRGDILPPLPMDYSQLPPAPVQHQVIFSGGYEQRSRGYVITVAPLGAVVGVLALLVATTLGSVPLLSFTAILVFWVGFAAVWLVSFVLHVATSADGIVLIHVLRMWNHIDREQRHRHGRIDRLDGD